MPLILARIYVEDIEFQSLGKGALNYKISPMSKIEKEFILEPEKSPENLSKSIEHRNNALRSSFE